MGRKLYEYDDGESATLLVKCQKCGGDIAIVARDEVEKRVASAQYVTRRASTTKAYDGGTSHRVEEGIFGVCRKCAETIRVQADAKGSEAAAEAQMIRIRDYVAEVRRIRPELSLERAVEIAVAYEFDPHREPDRGFRAYLLGEGAPFDADIDAKAREFMRQLTGPHAGGAA